MTLLRVSRVEMESVCGNDQRSDLTVVKITLSRNETAGLPSSPLSDEAHNAVVDWIDYIGAVESGSDE